VAIVEQHGPCLETEERKKDRARLLLDRYGILFRELLQRELAPFRWAGVFRSLRIMELSGEVMAGIFFHGIPGPQFISHQAFRNLQHKLPEDAVYWMNATDPASLCGIQLDSIRGSLPPRLSGTHLVYRGTKLVFISRRNGRELTFNVPPMIRICRSTWVSYATCSPANFSRSSASPSRPSTTKKPPKVPTWMRCVPLSTSWSTTEASTSAAKWGNSNLADLSRSKTTFNEPFSCKKLLAIFARIFAK